MIKNKYMESKMKNTKTIMSGAIAGALALGLAAVSPAALAGKPGLEKCQGIVKTVSMVVLVKQQRTLWLMNGFMFLKERAARLWVVRLKAQSSFLQLKDVYIKGHLRVLFCFNYQGTL
jgi:hypothetical protein